MGAHLNRGLLEDLHRVWLALVCARHLLDEKDFAVRPGTQHLEQVERGITRTGQHTIAAPATAHWPQHTGRAHGLLKSRFVP